MINQPEIIEDILSRVPAKSIGRFRCVSKPWKSLLSQPQFIKTHLNRTKQSPFVQQSLILVTHVSSSLFTTQLNNAHHMFDEMTVFASTLNIDDHQFDSEAIIFGKVASCDGLTLFEDSEWRSRRRLLLVNPTTKEFKLLPESPYAFDTDVSSYTMYGVGYDLSSDDYKVVNVFFYDNDNDLNAHRPDADDVFVNVYSVKNGTWKQAANSPYDHAVGHPTSGVFVDGHIYWLASSNSDYSSVIVAFDLGEEKFCEVPPPISVEGSNFVFHHLLSLGGCLSLFASNKDYKTDVWVMKEYGVKASWTKISIVDTKKSEFRPLCLLGKEQVVLLKDEETDEEKLVVYNLKDESFKDILVQGVPDEFGVGGTFMESLVSPHCGVEATS